jgi:hypothetical protein
MLDHEPPRPLNRRDEDDTSVPEPGGPPSPPITPPTDGGRADKKGPAKLSKKQKKWIKDAHRPLDSWERYRALTDVLDEALDLVDLADHKARFALIIMTAINAVIFLLGARTDAIKDLPEGIRPWLLLGFILYILTALYFYLQAIESLRPRKAQPPVGYAGESDLEEHPLCLRFYEDILSRDLEAYRRAWRDIRIGQLNAELAVQAHALAQIIKAKYAALQRLYRGLQIMIVMGALLLIAGAISYFFAGGAGAGFGKHVKIQNQGDGRADGTSAAPARNWSEHPPLAERTTSAQLVGLGDVHGAYDRLVSLLTTAGLIKKDGQAPGGYAWAGGNRLLVSVGDLINKGDKSIEVIDLLRALQSQAPRSGGEVIITYGNHEVEFLGRPERRKTQEFAAELKAKGIDPEKVAAGQHEYGVWLRNLPLAARVNAWFFAHAGDTGQQSREQLSAKFRGVVDHDDWKSPFLVGDDSILESDKWWRHPDAVDRDLAALQVKHIVFGHDPLRSGQIEQRYDGKMFRIDVGMTPSFNYSKGALLLVDRQGGTEVATSLDADGKRQELWRGPPG